MPNDNDDLAAKTAKMDIAAKINEWNKKANDKKKDSDAEKIAEKRPADVSSENEIKSNINDLATKTAKMEIDAKEEKSSELMPEVKLEGIKSIYPDLKEFAENPIEATSHKNVVKLDVDDLATKTAKMVIDAKEEKSSELMPEVKLEGIKSIYPDLKEFAENPIEATSHKNVVKLDVDDLALKTAKMVIEKKLREYPDMKEIAENHRTEPISSGNVVKLNIDDLPTDTAIMEAKEKLIETSGLVPEINLEDTETMEESDQTGSLLTTLDDILRLNIGGTRKQAAVSDLIKRNGIFKTMLESEDPIPQDDYGYIFIDRSPKHFNLIYNFMIDGKDQLPNHANEVEEILNEAQYYRFPELEELCKKKLRELADKDLRASTAKMDVEEKLMETSQLVPEVKLENTNAMDIDIKSAENVVRFQVRGSRFRTTRTTLTKFNGMFKTMLESEDPIPRDNHGNILIDRSPKHFELILNFMRDGKAPLPRRADKVEEIRNEAQYYQLAELDKLCEKKLRELNNNDSPASTAKKEAEKKLTEPRELAPEVKLKDTNAMDLDMIKIAENVVKLDVGGDRFKTTRTTLTNFNGMLKTMFETENPIPHNESGYIFIDRSPKHFEFILNFMRDGKAKLPKDADKVEEIQNEAKYYQLAELVKLCKEKLQESAELFNKDIRVLDDPGQLLQVIAQPKKLILVIYFHSSNGSKIIRPWGFEIKTFLEYYQNKLEIFFVPFNNGELLASSKPSPWTWSLHYKTKYLYNFASKKDDDWSKVIEHDIYKFAKENNIKP